jgi:hemerythrin-like metal-binding protein
LLFNHTDGIYSEQGLKMPLLQWNSYLSTGISSIDEQHKKLIDMINTLNDAFMAGKANDVLSQIFADLSDYTSRHFGYEEQLFAEHGYPESEAHKNEHEALINQVQALHRKMEQGDFIISIEVMAFLKDWLTNHILKTDVAYSQFLIERGVK